VRLINNWPNPQARNATSDKVPSIISYKNGKVDKWGYNVRANDESFRWIKILLEPDSKYTKVVEPVRKSNELLAKLGKTAVEVVSDYIREIWKYTMDDIQKRQGDDFREIYALKVVITVPAMWTQAAKEKTEQAAKLAGLPDDIAMVTEPEAAALATLKDKSDSDELAVGIPAFLRVR
jgi:molecular chaperone DnaK (HSP70)